MPEAEEIKVGGGILANEALIAGLARCLDRAEVVAHGSHPSEYRCRFANPTTGDGDSLIVIPTKEESSYRVIVREATVSLGDR